MSISIGEPRGLQQLADARGMMTMCAIDHTGALNRALNEKNPDAVSYKDITVQSVPQQNMSWRC